MARILNQAQAQAIYSTMCALNNVGGKAKRLEFEQAIVSTDSQGTVSIWGKVADAEYPSQSAFAADYGLQLA